MVSPIRKMFDEIANRYDFLNHFLSCGQDVVWRRYCCRQMKKFCRDPQVFGGVRDITLLDMCGGTGDFARAFRKALGRDCVNVVVGDFSYGMLRLVRPKGIDATAVQCDAMKLPFGDESFKMMLNGFGMRNVPDARGALQESFRVLECGGYLCVLEFFAPRNFFNRFFYNVLAPVFIPLMGAFFSGKRDAYVYLVQSVKRFLPVKDFCRIAEECCFEVAKVKSFNGGISYGVFLRKPAEASRG